MVENDIMQAKKIVGVYYDKGKQADSEMPILPERSEAHRRREHNEGRHL